jgi:microcystin-dependent protein
MGGVYKSIEMVGTSQQSFDDANNIDPTGRYYGRGNPVYSPPSALGTMAFQTLAPAGGGLPHNNMQPYLTLNFCIALQGGFPPRR